MSSRKLVLALALWALPSATDGASEMDGPAVESSPAELTELLKYDCGVDNEELRFNWAIMRLGDSTIPYLLHVLFHGAPESAREEARAQASDRFDRRQAWLTEKGEELFGEESAEQLKRPRQDYIGDALRRLDVRFRENALRALAIVGGLEELEPIAAAAEARPDLRSLADRALGSIESRLGERMTDR